MQNQHYQAQVSGFTHTSPCLAAVFDLKPPLHLAVLKITSGYTGYRKVNIKLSMKEGQNVKLWLLQSIPAAKSFKVIDPLASVLLQQDGYFGEEHGARLDGLWADCKDPPGNDLEVCSMPCIFICVRFIAEREKPSVTVMLLFQFFGALHCSKPGDYLQNWEIVVYGALSYLFFSFEET